MYNNNQFVSNGDRAWCKRCHRRETRGIRNTDTAKRSHLNGLRHQDAMRDGFEFEFEGYGSSFNVGIAIFGNKSPQEIAKLINED